MDLNQWDFEVNHRDLAGIERFILILPVLLRLDFPSLKQPFFPPCKEIKENIILHF